MFFPGSQGKFAALLLLRRGFDVQLLRVLQSAPQHVGVGRGDVYKRQRGIRSSGSMTLSTTRHSREYIF